MRFDRKSKMVLFESSEIDALRKEAYEIGKRSREEGLRQSVMDNPVYAEFSTKNMIAYELSGNMKADNEIMAAYHNGYEGKDIDHIPPILKALYNAFGSESTKGECDVE